MSFLKRIFEDLREAAADIIHLVGIYTRHALAIWVVWGALTWFGFPPPREIGHAIRAICWVIDRIALSQHVSDPVVKHYADQS